MTHQELAQELETELLEEREEAGIYPEDDFDKDSETLEADPE